MGFEVREFESWVEDYFKQMKNLALFSSDLVLEGINVEQVGRLHGC